MMPLIVAHLLFVVEAVKDFFGILMISSKFCAPKKSLFCFFAWNIGKVGEGGRGADTEDDCDDERNKVGGLVCQRHRQHRPQHRQAHSLILSHGATSVSGHL